MILTVLVVIRQSGKSIIDKYKMKQVIDYCVMDCPQIHSRSVFFRGKENLLLALYGLNKSYFGESVPYIYRTYNITYNLFLCHAYI